MCIHRSVIDFENTELPNINTMHLYQYLCFPLAIHISAHVFNFENLIQAYDGTSLQHALSIMEDVGNKTYINPVRNQNSVSVHNTHSSGCLWT